jgi:hypothetical protein
VTVTTIVPNQLAHQRFSGDRLRRVIHQSILQILIDLLPHHSIYHIINMTEVLLAPCACTQIRTYKGIHMMSDRHVQCTMMHHLDLSGLRL